MRNRKSSSVQLKTKLLLNYAFKKELKAELKQQKLMIIN